MSKVDVAALPAKPILGLSLYRISQQFQATQFIEMNDRPGVGYDDRLTTDHANPNRHRHG